MYQKKKLRIQQLDKKLAPYEAVLQSSTPMRGWIYTIRTSLNMTLRQLGKQLGISAQGARDIEQREVSGAVSLKALREVGEVLDMQLVYGFVPKGESVQAMVEARARVLATKIVRRTHHTMQLEAQGNSQERLEAAIEELTDELLREMNKAIWD